MILLIAFLANTIGACSLLNGVWMNELGSVATLKSAANGDVTGTYNSAVGKASGDYVVRGRIDKGCPSSTLSFVVSWTNANSTAHSCSSWSGVLLDDTIYTTWLLVGAVNSTDDVWASTRVGTNVFRRQ